MGIYEHIEELEGKPVRDFDADKGINEPSAAYRLALDYDDGNEFTQLFERFIADPNVGQVSGFVAGPWGTEMYEGEGDSSVIVNALVGARDKLSNLTALFLGDILSEECELSWIQQSDVSPLWSAFPKLESFTVRGGNDLSLGELKHENLRKMVVEAGGLDVSVVQQVGKAELPKLEHLELWLGEENYGANTTAADLAPILSGEKFPNLTYLGLRDSCITDDIAVAIADSPVLEKIDVLDLSMGTLGDEGATALLEFPLISRLKLLNIRHHYVSDEVISKLKAVGMPLNADVRQTPDDWGGELHRYVEIGE